MRPFETESLVDGDLIEDFCEQVGLRGFHGDRGPRVQKLNTAFTIRELLAIEHIRDVVSGRALHVGMFAKDFVKRYSDALQLGNGGAGFVSPSLARDILAMSSSDNHKIAKPYLGRDRLFINEGVSNDGKPPGLLEQREIARIDALLTTELLRLKTGDGSEEYGEHGPLFRALKMRAHIHRKQWKVGRFWISSGRLLRMSDLFLKSLWSKVKL